jgi:hypothetical protein
MQKLVLVQLTPLRLLPCLPVPWLGEVTRLHAVPFHFSIRVWLVAPSR